MPRPPRIDLKDQIFHVINRANARMTIFETDKDYTAFECVLKEAVGRFEMRLLGYIVMPNHFHLVLQPRKDGDVQLFMHWLTTTATVRWHKAHDTVGSGHIFQGRYKSFLVQNEKYFVQLMRYVERNALRSSLVTKAEDWRWGSLWRRTFGKDSEKTMLAEWPISTPENYLEFVNKVQPSEVDQLQKLRDCVNRGAPYGSDAWRAKTTKHYKLEATQRRKGRPLKDRKLCN